MKNADLPATRETIATTNNDSNDNEHTSNSNSIHNIYNDNDSISNSEMIVTSPADRTCRAASRPAPPPRPGAISIVSCRVVSCRMVWYSIV